MFALIRNFWEKFMVWLFRLITMYTFIGMVIGLIIIPKAFIEGEYVKAVAGCVIVYLFVHINLKIQGGS